MNPALCLSSYVSVFFTLPRIPATPGGHAPCPRAVKDSQGTREARRQQKAPCPSPLGGRRRFLCQQPPDLALQGLHRNWPHTEVSTPAAEPAVSSAPAERLVTTPPPAPTPPATSRPPSWAQTPPHSCSYSISIY